MICQSQSEIQDALGQFYPFDGAGQSVAAPHEIRCLLMPHLAPHSMAQGHASAKYGGHKSHKDLLSSDQIVWQKSAWGAWQAAALAQAVLWEWLPHQFDSLKWPRYLLEFLALSDHQSLTLS